MKIRTILYNLFKDLRLIEMKFLFKIITIQVLIYCNNLVAQNNSTSVLTEENYIETIANYKPLKNESISQSEFDYGKMIISEVQKTKRLDLLEYSNLLTAFLTLKESTENIHFILKKFIESDTNCEYTLAFERQFLENKKYEPIKKELKERITLCKAKSDSETKFDLEKYCKKYKLDCKLVKIIESVKINDEKNRKSMDENWAKKQMELDSKNQKIIDSLYKIHKTYIGKTLVGTKFEVVMWSVVQHGSVDYMEKYLPIIHKEYLNKNLPDTPLKMLLDRFYGLKYGYQFFGTQQGFGFESSNEDEIKKIKKKYQLN